MIFFKKLSNFALILAFLATSSCGLYKKVDQREMPDGAKVFGKSINDDPEKYFTKEVLKQIDEYANKKFRYGSDEE